MINIVTYRLEWLMGLNAYEIERLIKLNRLPLTMEPCSDEINILCYVLVDNNTNQAWDMYFGNHGIGHFNEPLTLLNPIED